MKTVTTVLFACLLSYSATTFAEDQKPTKCAPGSTDAACAEGVKGKKNKKHDGHDHADEDHKHDEAGHDHKKTKKNKKEK